MVEATRTKSNRVRRAILSTVYPNELLSYEEWRMHLRKEGSGMKFLDFVKEYKK